MSKSQKRLLVFIVGFIIIFFTLVFMITLKSSKEKEMIYIEKIGYINDYESYNIDGSTITINFKDGKRFYANYKCRIFPAKDFNESLGYPYSTTTTEDTMFIDNKIFRGKYKILKSTPNMTILTCNDKKYTFLNYGNSMRIRTSMFPRMELEA